MKKIILPLLLILTVGMLAAVESEPSEIVGYVKYDMYTGYSYVAQPMDITTTAQAIGIDNQTSVTQIYRFNTQTQGWESVFYDPDFGEWLGNFNVNPGDVLLFNCIADGSYYSIGNVPDPITYQIYPGFNYITIPLNRSDLVSAQTLGNEIGNIQIIYRFNNQTHGWESILYDSEFEEWIGDITLSLGDIVLLKSTASTTWPNRNKSTDSQYRASK
ncbi:MAG: hypothetical protein M0P53_08545 [Candidatus Cloacimonas sp.]|jgi:hypothetical protein|nr:hypothetical protein [Candidatus Cloacimonas sp.]